MPERPEWLEVGARVAIVSSGQTWESVAFDTVDRILKRDVVLASGRRFSETYGGYDERGRSGSYTRAPRLMAADAPAVAAIRTKNAQAAARNRVTVAHDQWRKSSTVEAAGALLAAIHAWRKVAGGSDA